MTSHGEGIEEEQISRIEKGIEKDCHGGIETIICTSPSIVCLTQKVENEVFCLLHSYKKYIFKKKNWFVVILFKINLS